MNIRTLRNSFLITLFGLTILAGMPGMSLVNASVAAAYSPKTIPGLWPSAPNSHNLLWNTFLGGTALDEGKGLAVDANGNSYIVGGSDATWGSPLRNFGGGSNDAVAAKVDRDGNLIWHTFFGGDQGDFGRAIAIDGSENIYITGESWASWGSPVRSFTSDRDVFVARVNNDGSLAWNTFLGGGGNVDIGYAITVDASNNIYVAGQSNAAWGSPKRNYASDVDQFVARLDAAGNLIE